MQQEYQKLLTLIMKYSYLGIEYNEATKAIKIGPAPHRAPLAFLNCIYQPITHEQIREIENKLDKKIPKDYSTFLTEFSNGLGIICTTLYLYGLRSNYIRSSEMIWQPWDIIENNSDFEIPQNSTNDMFFLGGYTYDLSNLYMDANGTIHYCSRYDATSLKTWPSLTEMLLSEIERLYSLHDEKGVLLTDRKHTLPIY